MRGRAFSLVELLVVVTIVALLAAVLFPVFMHSRRKAYEANCISNMRQMGVAVGLYQTDFDGMLPAGTIHRWRNVGPGGVKGKPDVTRLVSEPLQAYLRNRAVADCPVKGHGYIVRWVIRIHDFKASRLMRPDSTNVLLYCLHHLDEGWKGDQHSETIYSFGQRKGHYIALRSDLSVNRPNASELSMLRPISTGGQEAWLPCSGGSQRGHLVFKSETWPPQWLELPEDVSLNYGFIDQEHCSP